MGKGKGKGRRQVVVTQGADLDSFKAKEEQKAYESEQKQIA